ncbi:DUF6816 family protein [Kamptonema formosum]|uniref:DUF6816 family protein n=1 Tax=Kamptonema formosum TaxID=331992 RepID=UPI0003462CAD|nr:hypothetical protein [Oscillatoria sp. PCC 10802]
MRASGGECRQVRWGLRWIWGLCLLVAVLLWGAAGTQAGPLLDRMARFPNWESKPPVMPAYGDLAYPDWMAGTWKVTSTLVDMVAPLAPAMVSPGFESNRRYINVPVSFPVRFGPAPARSRRGTMLGVPVPVPVVPANRGLRGKGVPVVADRGFNGLSIARAYLGEGAVKSVKVDPDSPNRQVTLLQSSQLVSTVTGRLSERPAADRFVATEMFVQQFRAGSRVYLNEVETATAYQKQQQPLPAIEADQVTAIYLSPQDPDYFAAGGRPVALYRYRLQFFPESDGDAS